MGDVMIRAENLFYSYDGGKRFSLKGLSLEIRRGERVALMGANGSGKSTFFLCCNGLLRPSRGVLYLDGKPADYSKKGLLELRRRVGIVFQDPDSQLFFADIRQEIAFGLMNLKIPEGEAEEAVEEIIRRLGIEAYRDFPTHALSGGQKKQVSLADVLVMRPDAVLLDEPAASLDVRHRQIVEETVEGMAKEGITVVTATHDEDYALRWADRVIILKSGRVLAQGEPELIFRDRELLEEAGLRQPAVLRLFERLRESGALRKGMKTPRSMEELEKGIL